MRPKNMILSVYSLKGFQKGFLARSTEEVIGFLKPLIEEQYIQGFVDELILQRQDPNLFPNVVLFLDENDQLITIDRFMDQYK